MIERETILEKLRKIKAKAENEAATEQEAHAAAAKMADLMNRYAIEEHEIGDYTKAERFAQDMEQKYFDHWRRDLMDQICLTCGSTMLKFRYGSNKRVTIFGRPEQITATWEMFKFIEEQVVRISRELYPGNVRSSRRAQAGLGIGVASMLYHHRQKDIDNLANLPVVLESEQAKEFSRSWAEENGINIVAPKKTKIVGRAETMHGFNNAGRVQLRDHIK